MTEVKSLNITADTYRHRGWMWRDRGTYEVFKARMKLPLWIDRILTDSGGDNLFVVGKADGDRNTSYVGSFGRGVEKGRIWDSQPDLASYNCNSRVGNGFVVIAERIRAKKPDANKAPRPLWRQRMTKPWEPTVLGGNWILDSTFVESVSLNTPPPPAWADRLWVSTSAGTDTFVWVNSAPKGQGIIGTLHAAQNAVGIRGHQPRGPFEPDEVVCHSGCYWQLAGVRKKATWVPEPEVIKPEPDVPPMHATAVRAVQAEQIVYDTATGRIPLLAAPYDTDIYASIAQAMNTTRAEAKLRAFREAYTQPNLGRMSIDFHRVDFAELERLADAYLAPKPPLGVKPRNVHDEERANALDEAMDRYLSEDLPFPIEWAVEWNELRARLNKEQK